MKLKLGSDQLSELLKSLRCLLASGQQQANISEIDYYNTRSLMKKMLDKLYNASLKPTSRKKELSINVDLNEHQCLINVYALNKDHVPEVVGEYYEVLYGEVFSQLDRQKISIQVPTIPIHEQRALPY